MGVVYLDGYSLDTTRIQVGSEAMKSAELKRFVSKKLNDVYGMATTLTTMISIMTSLSPERRNGRRVQCT